MERYLKMLRDVLEPEADLGTVLKNIQQLTDFIEAAFTSRATGRVLLYLVHRGAATSWILQCDLGIPESSVYRALKRLRSVGVVVPALKVATQRKTKGGPRPTMWVTELTTTGETAAALRRHYRLLSPKYRVAEQISQAILDEFTPGEPREVKFAELMIRVKSLRLPFVGVDVADLAANYLHESGVKVWR